MVVELLHDARRGIITPSALDSCTLVQFHYVTCNWSTYSGKGNLTTYTMRVHLEHESALGCMRVHLIKDLESEESTLDCPTEEETEMGIRFV